MSDTKIREPRQCACGCGEWFVPKRKDSQCVDSLHYGRMIYNTKLKVRHEPRQCACGCGEWFVPGRSTQTLVEQSHRQRLKQIPERREYKGSKSKREKNAKWMREYNRPLLTACMPPAPRECECGCGQWFIPLRVKTQRFVNNLHAARFKNKVPPAKLRFCACGCGQSFMSKSYRHRFVDKTHNRKFFNSKRPVISDDYLEKECACGCGKRFKPKSSRQRCLNSQHCNRVLHREKYRPKKRKNYQEIECACGCGKWFKPKSSLARFIDNNHSARLRRENPECYRRLKKNNLAYLQRRRELINGIDRFMLAHFPEEVFRRIQANDDGTDGSSGS